jgi:hypothetical protein
MLEVVNDNIEEKTRVKVYQKAIPSWAKNWHTENGAFGVKGAWVKS